jgi:NADH/F420H2 dehydrogenase subunit C
MTVVLAGTDVAPRITDRFPEAVIESDSRALVVKREYLTGVADYLKNTPETAFDYLADISSVDYYDYFDVVYQLVSLEKNHRLTLKTRCYDREKPVVPSVTALWQGADLMEREIYDLMGIGFAGHPNLKRIVLWQGFDGHPLRKDYL